ncbi:ARHGEF12 [Lepeophtheirus salmonis]|uniref:ARHGEF12 n=1 Tax=Lepeophtheirus salmonis TaxID=72036 RepID=A0A7R8D120_LEPSM|nr:ARHGEF12 [Lepeophtheirus salmonis]CAF2946620.1 ARHGEF12 [Lepeophtheirus salmonis]
MTMKKRRSSSDDILEENFVQNTKIRLSDIYTKLSLIDGRLRSFEDSNHKIMDKIAILESSVQILETYAVNAAVVGRNGSIALNGNKNLSSSMTSLLQPLTESDDEGTENSESVSTPTALTYEESLSISRSQSFTDIPKLYNNNHHAPISHHKSSPPPITPQFIPPSPSPSIKNSVKFRDKPSAISGITKSRTVGASDSRFSWSGTTSFSKQEKVEYIKTGPLEVKKRFTGYKLYWCCLKSDLSLLLFSYPEHLRQPDCPVRHRPKYTMRLRGCYCVLRDVNEKNGYEEDPSQKVGRFDFIRIDNNSIYNQFAATSYHEAKDWVDTFENVALTMATENGLRKKHQRRISAQSLNDLHILKRSSLDSPAGSLQEMVSSSNPNSNLSTSSRGGGSNNGSGGGVPPPPPPPLPPSDSSITSSNHNSQHPPFWDSDFETEPDPPDWRFSMNQEDLVKLKPKEKKRQDVINEFFHTERSHVRNLKNMIMKDRIKSQGFPIGDISDLFLEMFDGPNGDSLIELGSEFTQNQKFTIEELKKKRARDHKFDAFLSDLERRPECRRLGLESILPVEHQRLDSSYSTIKNCVERTKFILDSIDKRVAEAQNLQRLAEIQKNLDTSGLEKNPESSIPAEYKNCDLTKHRLIYDGPLTLKLGDTRRFKTVDLHVVLLEDCIMLLQKQDDKYLLKFHTSGAASSTGDKKFFHSPIIEFSTMLVRPVATDKRAFYLLNITQTVPQIYELVASSSADRSQWFRHITEASNAYRARDNRRNFRTTGGISPLPDTGSNNNNRETSSTNGLTSSTSVDNTRKDSSSLLGVKGILPAGRSHSFHESSSSSRESPPERQPSSPPEDITKGDCSVNEGAGGGSGSTTPRKRLQRVEILKIAEPSPLIDPSQVVVTQGEILVADPVLTPIEKLRPDIFQIPTDDFDAIADIASQPSQNKDAREVLLAALAQANSLSELLNESLNLTEEDTIAASSQFKSPPISMSFLTSLLAIFQMREEERDRSRHCLQRYQDQIDVYLSDSTTCPVVRPVSFISVEENSSGIQDSEEDEEKRAEKSQSTNQSVSLDIAANVEGVLVSESSNPNSGERALLEDSIDRKFQIEEEEAEGGNESDGSLSPQEGEGVRLLPETNDVVIKTEDEDHTKCLTNPAMEETSSSTGDSPKNETEQSDEP